MMKYLIQSSINPGAHTAPLWSRLGQAYLLRSDFSIWRASSRIHHFYVAHPPCGTLLTEDQHSLTTEPQAGLFRKQLSKVLDSPEFEGSRQARQFLRFVGDAALEGREELEQSEIAATVLHRGEGFNPVDSSSVRKLATLCRQRLERYYAGTGAQDPVVISLPLRSYLPKFRLPDEERAQEPAAVAESVLWQKKTGARAWWIGGVAVCAVIAVALALAWTRRSSEAPTRLVIQTRPGGFADAPIDLSGGSVRLGGPVRAVADLRARMTFRPVRNTQIAGIVVYDGPRHYVKFGRRFNLRTEWELAWGTDRMDVAAPQYFYDPQGQTGSPMWLLLRRERADFSAFVSPDRWMWQQIGQPVRIPEEFRQARLGVYGHNGRSDAPPAEAVFENIAVGLSFQGRTNGAIDLSTFEGWGSATSCGATAPVTVGGGALNFDFETFPRGCNWDFVTPAPTADWTMVTRIDFLPLAGDLAGLTVKGSAGEFRVVRWNANGGSILAEHVSRNQVNATDYPGRPPITLRLQARQGSLRASFSRDEQEFADLPIQVRLQDLGSKLQVGLHAMRPSWSGIPASEPARFHDVFWEVPSLSPPGKR